MKMREKLRGLFGFQSVSVMLKSEDQGQLFTTISPEPHHILEKADDFVYYPLGVGLTGQVQKTESKS